jgi:hypothetical protein
MMSTKLADDPQTENAKKVYEQEKKATEKTRSEYARLSKGKPTPTQEENDLANLGAHILEHEEDGSDPDPNVTSTRHMEADRSQHKPQNYATRQQHSKSE